MTEHTPGPWRVGNRYMPTGVFTADGELVANTHGAQRNFQREEQIQEQNANARLIAAAPELLVALKQAQVLIAMAGFHNNNQTVPIWDANVKLIAKAEGKDNDRWTHTRPLESQYEFQFLGNCSSLA